MIAHLYLKSSCLLKDAILNLANNCIKDIQANKINCERHLLNSSAFALIFINEFGYDKTAEYVKKANDENLTFIDYLKKYNLIDQNKLKSLIKKELGVEIE
jgi:aspartate ammonia-lyase